jgi:hypothetical protein
MEKRGRLLGTIVKKMQAGKFKVAQETAVHGLETQHEQLSRQVL